MSELIKNYYDIKERISNLEKEKKEASSFLLQEQTVTFKSYVLFLIITILSSIFIKNQEDPLFWSIIQCVFPIIIVLKMEKFNYFFSKDNKALGEESSTFLFLAFLPIVNLFMFPFVCLFFLADIWRCLMQKFFNSKFQSKKARKDSLNEKISRANQEKNELLIKMKNDQETLEVLEEDTNHKEISNIITKMLQEENGSYISFYLKNKNKNKQEIENI